MWYTRDSISRPTRCPTDITPLFSLHAGFGFTLISTATTTITATASTSCREIKYMLLGQPLLGSRVSPFRGDFAWRLTTPNMTSVP